MLGCTNATACNCNSLANTLDPSDPCNYLIFSGYTKIDAASSATAIDAMIQPVIGGTGGSGTYALATEDGQVFWSAMWGMMPSGRWEFKILDDAGCESVESYNTLIPYTKCD